MGRLQLASIPPPIEEGQRPGTADEDPPQEEDPTMITAKLSDDSRLRWWCPGCESNHVVPVAPGEPTGWQFDGNLEAPTLNPSILIYAHDRMPPEKNQPRCHTFVREGRIEFLTDCTHALAGQTVPMGPVR